MRHVKNKAYLEFRKVWELSAKGLGLFLARWFAFELKKKNGVRDLIGIRWVLNMKWSPLTLITITVMEIGTHGPTV